jgi:large subunit ribosomal protein L33
MAKKKDVRMVVKLRSTVSGHVYITQKNRRNDPQRLELMKYDPFVRRHVLYREAK